MAIVSVIAILCPEPAEFTEKFLLLMSAVNYIRFTCN